MNFNEFLNRLPACADAEIITDSGFTYIEAPNNTFIGPDLAPNIQVPHQKHPQVIILSAAGAVGKTTLARAIAQKRKAPIWDLALAPAVGEKSLTGQLTDSFGFGNVGEISKLISNNELFLIIDALDEARVKTNEAGFEAFINDISKIASISAEISIILLARTQTAETAWLLLDETSIKTALLSIQPFTKEQATQYIDSFIQNYSDHGAAYQRISQHRIPFEAARDTILNQLERAVSGNSPTEPASTREFLGYAPVLGTVATLLSLERNFSELMTQFGNTDDVSKEERPFQVLDQVLDKLLIREQEEKLKGAIRVALEDVARQANWDKWDTLYSPNEQRTRLLTHILGIQTPNYNPLLPADVQAKYEEHLRTWLPEHPFLRDGKTPANKVFESYLFADALLEYLTVLGKRVEQLVSGEQYKPTRLLADFYFHLAKKANRTEIPERHTSILYDSLSAGETDTLRVGLNFENGDPEDDDNDDIGEAEFILVYSGGTCIDSENNEPEIKTFNIAHNTGPLQFRNQLKCASIISKGTLTLGGASRDFEIGPEVIIRTSSLEIIAEGLVVRPGINGRDDVSIESISTISHVCKMPLVRGKLQVLWPGSASFPWTEYSVELSDQNYDSEQMHEVHRRLRRIITSLRSHSKGSLARLRDKIEHRRLLKNQIGNALLTKLLDDGILHLKGKFYHWVPERASTLLSLSWVDLRSRELTPELKSYLTNFIESNQVLFKET